MQAFALLPFVDWLALSLFVAGWVTYAWFAQKRSRSHLSILASTNRIRYEWMRQVTYREVRVLDGVVVQNLSSSPSFFASTTILIVGGLLAVLGTNGKATDFVREIPFAVHTSRLVFDLKVVAMLMVYVYSFFRFTWSMRQYTFVALLIASAPESEQFATLGLSRQAYAQRAGRVVGLAAESFNDGLRAYYFSSALIAWFFSPWFFMLCTGAVITILYQREFHSDVLASLSAQPESERVHEKEQEPKAG